MDRETSEWLRSLSPQERGEAIQLLQEKATDDLYGSPLVDPDDALAHLEN